MILAQPNKSLFYLFAGLFTLAAIGVSITKEYFLFAIPFAVLFFYASWNHRLFIFYGLLVTLPLSFEYSFSASLGTDFPDELLMLLTSFLFVGTWILSPRTLTIEKIKHPLMVVLFLLMSWAVVATYFSVDKLISVKYVLAKSWYVGAFVIAPLIVFRTKKMIALGALAITVPMLFVAVVSLLKHAQYGFSFSMVSESVAPFFRNHVNYSSMLVCVIPILAAVWKLNKSKKWQPLIVTALLLALLALFFSYARGAWLALLAGVLAYWLLQKKLLVVAYVLGLLLAVAGIFWLKADDRYLDFAHDYKSTIFHQNFNEHLIATYQLKDVSTAERFYRWIAAVRMVKDSWVTGNGPSTFYDTYRPYTIPAYKTWVSNNNEHSTVHNYFLLLLVEQGLTGLLLFCFLTGLMFYYAQRLYHQLKDMFFKTLSITIAVLLTMILVVNSLSDLIETDKIGSLFFLCLTVLVITDLHHRKLEVKADQ